MGAIPLTNAYAALAEHVDADACVLLMSTDFTVELEALARRVLYLDAIRQTTTASQVHAVIEAQRRQGSRPRFSIPI